MTMSSICTEGKANKDVSIKKRTAKPIIATFDTDAKKVAIGAGAPS